MMNAFWDIAPSRFRLFMLFIGIASLVFLYFWNPSEISSFPKCPFFAITGYQCPGCGTLRGIHALLHFRIADAWGHNPFMIVSIPVVFSLLLWPRFRFSVLLAYIILCATLLWWLIRNFL